MGYSFLLAHSHSRSYPTPNYLSLPYAQLMAINITHKYNHTSRRPISGQQLQLLFAAKQCIHMFDTWLTLLHTSTRISFASLVYHP